MDRVTWKDPGPIGPWEIRIGEIHRENRVVPPDAGSKQNRAQVAHAQFVMG